MKWLYRHENNERFHRSILACQSVCSLRRHSMRAMSASLFIIFTMSGDVNSRGLAAGNGSSNQFNWNERRESFEAAAAASRARVREASSSTAVNPHLP